MTRPYRYLYKSARWKVMRIKKRQANPLCERHLARGQIVRMTQVHHKIPHRGNRDLFFDEDNLESLCDSCHNSEAQQQEKGGFSSTIGPDGWPYDSNHPTYKGT